MSRHSHVLDVCLRPEHLRRTLAIALVVGAWFTLYNQVVTGTLAIDGETALAVVLNFLTPFVVANWGLLSRESASG